MNATGYNSSMFDLDGGKYVVDCVITGIITLLGTAINLSALFAMKYGVKTFLPVHRLLVSLTISDILALTGSWPRLVVDGYQGCVGSRAIHCWEVSVRLLSLSSLVGLALDQYVAICKPLHYEMILNKTMVTTIIITTYLVSFVTGHLTLIQGIFRWIANPSQDCEGYVMKGTGALMINTVACVVIIATLAIFVLYLLVVCEITKISKTISDSGCRNHTNSKKAIKITTLVIGTYLLFCCPVIVIYYTTGSGTPYLLLRGAIWWSMLNSICDPLIYSLRMKDIRYGFTRMVRTRRTVTTARPNTLVSVLTTNC